MPEKKRKKTTQAEAAIRANMKLRSFHMYVAATKRLAPDVLKNKAKLDQLGSAYGLKRLSAFDDTAQRTIIESKDPKRMLKVMEEA